ncbi:hypothetical protein [Pyrobaculum aerophilum]|uniref:Uncharacterized protein n=1 Tax=Pyrobaculum aerophilum TaxID=13773 RepID=A0A832WH06_9CREN|nr:hypothetical protein [Pyrobaculum aerophilum]HII47005.1 hypothetical protein [Pyrobaculum aerophilum]
MRAILLSTRLSPLVSEECGIINEEEEEAADLRPISHTDVNPLQTLRDTILK